MVRMVRSLADRTFQLRFRHAIRDILTVPEVTISEYEVGKMFELLDQDGSGEVELSEFLGFLYHHRCSFDPEGIRDQG